MRWGITLALVLFAAAGGEDFRGQSLSDFCGALLEGKSGAIYVADLSAPKIICAVGDSAILSGTQKFPPGSVFKIITAVAALEQGIDPRQQVKCTYWYEIPDGERLPCSWRPGHGKIDLVDAIGKSCSFYFYSLIDRGVSIARIENVAKIFFDIPQSPYFAEFYREDGADFPYRFAVGLTGVLVSPKSVLRMITAVATAGELPDFERERYDKIRLSDDSEWGIIRKGLRRVTTTGICAGIFPDSLSVAGKTGTAPLPENPAITCGWFAGYCPAGGKPEYAVVVFLVDATGYTDAAPLAEKVFEFLHRGRK